MAQQFDEIQALYDEANQPLTGLLRKEQVRSIVHPLVQGAAVLELACGSGFFSESLIEWGANSVTGIDISAVMVEAAKRRAASRNLGDKVQFMVADCMQLAMYQGAPFDFVFAAWLLDNAPDKQSMVQMFQTVSLNLKDSGVFVSVTLPPASDPKSMLRERDRVRKQRPTCEGFYAASFMEIPNGLSVDWKSSTPLGLVQFQTYYLTKEVHEASARDAGLMGKLEWIPQQVTENMLRGTGAYEQHEVRISDLMTYNVAPEYAILMINKS